MNCLAKSASRTVLLLCAMVAPLGAVASAQSKQRASVEVIVPAPPAPIKADGGYQLVYELHITNFDSEELTLWRVEVQSDDPAAFPFGQYEGAELLERLQRPGYLVGLPDKRRIGPGARAIVFLWLTVDARSALPSALTHRLTFSRGKSNGGVVELVEEGPRVKLGAQPTVLGPPLRGDGWLAANGPSNVSLHRRTLIPIEGKAAIAQRFAIDWLKLGEDGKSWTGDRLKNASYHAYGAEVLAVADGTVVSAKDQIPDNVPGSRAVPITLETVAGNHVIIDIGGGRFAFYAHLQPGSLRVQKGDKVQQGQVLGLVGNSGNSSEPHLHFHLGDANSPLAAEGLPYLLAAFDLRGRGWGWKPSDSLAEERRAELPLQNMVVRFKEVGRLDSGSAVVAEANPADVASIDAILGALYDVISGPAGKRRDWARFRSLFLPGARLVPTRPRDSGGFDAQPRDVESYVTSASAYFEKNGFFEREIARRTELFGHIAHVFSTYESRHKAEDTKPFARGINSIQLMNDGKRWWLVTIFWEAEGPGNQIPKKYLKGSK